MKTRATTILAALAALTSTYATNISSEINWGQDSDTGFELTIIGTGLDYVDTFTSPSGLWSISAGVTGHYYQTDYMPEGKIEIAHLVRATYLPENLLFRTKAYDDMFPIGRASYFDSGEFERENSEQRAGWSGFIPLTITYLPHIFDNSAWQWTLTAYLHGPSLAKHVPDYGNGGMCLAFAAGLLLFFRPRKEKAWTS